MLPGFDDDLASGATHLSNRSRSPLTGIRLGVGDASNFASGENLATYAGTAPVTRLDRRRDATRRNGAHCRRPELTAA